MRKAALFLIILFVVPLSAKHFFYVHQGESVNQVLQKARVAYESRPQPVIIWIDPGTYCEELTIDIPHLTLRNSAKHPSIAMRKGGVDIDSNAVRLTWYYGHGYQYRSMSTFNYGGKRARLWNASVLVTAPYFRAEDIIFENSFNMYVCAREAADSLVDISKAKTDWTEKERPKREMPQRPKRVGSTEVQNKFYRERASALSFAATAHHCQLLNCRIVGRQDALYGDHGASLHVKGGALCGAVDYIFGGMDLTVDGAELVAMTNTDKGDKCYISAGRGANRKMVMKAYRSGALSKAAMDSIPQEEYARQGMVFRNCTVRHATADELVNPGTKPIWLGRPWRWWGRTLFRNVKAAPGILQENPWSLGLTKGHPAPWVSSVGTNVNDH